MSRRNLWITLASSVFLVVTLTYVVIDGRISKASDLNKVAVSALSQSRILREKTVEIGADEEAWLDWMTPATLTPTDLADVVKSIADSLGLRMVKVSPNAAPISQEDALVAINLEPSVFPDYFSVVTASVQVRGDIPRLMELLENLKNVSANGPLRGVVEIKFTFNGSNSTLSVGLVGVRFNGGSPATVTPTTVENLSGTTLPSNSQLPVETSVAP
jgi:hypothetical protein